MRRWLLLLALLTVGGCLPRPPAPIVGRWVQDVRSNPAVLEFDPDGTGRYTDPLRFDRPSVQSFHWSLKGADAYLTFDLPQRQLIAHTLNLDDSANAMRFTVRHDEAVITGDGALLRVDVPLDPEANEIVDPEWCQCDPEDIRKMHGWYEDIDEFDHRVAWSRVGTLSHLGL